MEMEHQIKIMVASTVHGFEDQLTAICAELSTMGYQVLNSHIGSMRVNPLQSNLENCLEAVRMCDVFLGIIRPYYGSGNIEEINITFEEMKLAVQLPKPYWFLVHHDVVFARQLMKYLYYTDPQGNKVKEVKIEKSQIFDARTLDIYDFVIKHGKPIATRTGNWAQEFFRLDEALTYIRTQYGDLDFIRNILIQNKHD